MTHADNTAQSLARSDLPVGLSPHIFRAYDIRGVVDRTLDAALMYRIGAAYGQTVRALGGRTVVVGRDGRHSSPAYAQAFKAGLAAVGVQVTDIGMVPTPVLNWSVQHLSADGGAQITGSHNPSEHNGVKLTACGKPLCGDDLQRLYQQVAAQPQDFAPVQPALSQHTEKVRCVSTLESYIQDLTARFTGTLAPVRVVVDAGNGVGGMTAVPVLRALGCEVVPLFADVDGSFPNHHADPTVAANLQSLIKTVQRTQAFVGLAFDGDADRLGVVDAQGRIVWGDMLLTIFGRALLKRHPGALVIGEVKCSQRLFDAIAQAGGKPVMWRTGHSWIKQAMQQTGASLAGEMSGHFFFGQQGYNYGGFDDAAFAALLLLQICHQENSSPQQLLADLKPVYNTPELRFEVPEEHKFAVVQSVLEYVQQHSAQEGIRSIVQVDGVRVHWPDRWILVRASNTQALLVCRAEADTPQQLDLCQRWLDTQINRARAQVCKL